MNAKATATRIAEIYSALVDAPQGYVHFSLIRPELADVSREDQDAALAYLQAGNAVEVDGTLVEGVPAPDSSRARNHPEHVAAAFRGCHWIAFQDAE